LRWRGDTWLRDNRCPVCGKYPGKGRRRACEGVCSEAWTKSYDKERNRKRYHPQNLCRTCGQLFVGDGHWRHCPDHRSPRSLRRYGNAPDLRPQTCVRCGEPMEQPTSGAKKLHCGLGTECLRNHQKLYARSKATPKSPCLICGDPVSFRRAYYCSTECRTESAWYQVIRARYGTRRPGRTRTKLEIMNDPWGLPDSVIEMLKARRLFNQWRYRHFRPAAWERARGASR